MRRLAGDAGGYYRGDEPSRPSFGVLPADLLERPSHRGLPSPPYVAVKHDDPRADFKSGVEFDLHGHRMLAVHFVKHGHFSLVQLRTPVVPAMVIVPVVDDMRPLMASRIHMNSLGNLRLTDPLDDVGWLDDLIGNVDVLGADPDAARELLTPEVQRAILNVAWREVHTIAFEHGAMWVAHYGWLKESVVRDNARHLAWLAALIPAEGWQRASTGTRSADR